MITNIILSILTSFIITFLMVPVIIKFSKGKKKLLDKPGRRKIHKRRTPSMGGVGIFLGFFVSLMIWLPHGSIEENKYILTGILIIFSIGLRDDIVPLKALYKLIGQIIAASIIVLLTGVQLNSLYGLFGVDYLNDTLSSIITIFTIIVITNSFNLIDGLDGLAATIATIALLCFGVWFYLIGNPAIAVLSVSMAGAIIAFLIFNWEPSKVFMGDTGALVVGFLFAVLAVSFIDKNYHLPVTSAYKFNASISTAICIIIIPLFDTLRVFILRLSKGQSPFLPDKNHMHHALIRLGLNHSQTAISLGGLNFLYIVMALIFHKLSDNIMLPSILILSVFLSLTLDFLIIRKLKRP